MIRISWYLDAMKDAGIPIMRKEKAILDLYRKDRIDERRFMNKMKRMGVPVTNHQETIIKMLACIDKYIGRIGERNGV